MDVKKIIDRDLLRTLQNNYYMAKAMYETIKGLSHEIRQKVLEENAFYEAPDESGVPKRIYDPDRSWLMDQDADFLRYLDLCYKRYIEAGIANERGKEYLPEAESKDLCTQAETALLHYALSIVPHKQGAVLLNVINDMKYREIMLDYILRLEL